MPRKPKQDDRGKRWPLSLRTTLRLKNALDAAAERSGRSLAQEVEVRLERSIQAEASDNIFVTYKGVRWPLIVHKGGLILVLGASDNLAMEISGKDLETLLERVSDIDRTSDFL